MKNCFKRNNAFKTFKVFLHKTSRVIELLEFPLPNALRTWHVYDPASVLETFFSTSCGLGTKIVELVVEVGELCLLFGMITATGGEGLMGIASLYHITSVTLGGLALKLHVKTASPVSFTTKPSAG